MARMTKERLERMKKLRAEYGTVAISILLDEAFDEIEACWAERDAAVAELEKLSHTEWATDEVITAHACLKGERCQADYGEREKPWGLSEHVKILPKGDKDERARGGPMTPAAIRVFHAWQQMNCHIYYLDGELHLNPLKARSSLEDLRAAMVDLVLERQRQRPGSLTDPDKEGAAC